ncbi:hypothetical protein BJ138DRAFT_1058742 [Hygrophoropsis aurantiaca]|uniref:Uncharacterized protein n=1 Tax=Hygrophoropsis aurantiaca TaxID=72124 RepID=A0ACB8AJZ8_9AGAM|nr:hypothetical protein BJ138DRAFT_1058742 [Hygrophoropsis aurantiaca]
MFRPNSSGNGTSITSSMSIFTQPVVLLSITLSALTLCLLLNTLTIQHLRGELAKVHPVSAEADDSGYSYVGDDHPNSLPIDLPPIALTIEDTKKFGLVDVEAWVDWRSTDYFPGRAFGISMFHQMHCLQMIRHAVLYPNTANGHTHHCLNLLRQAVLCAADVTLDPLDVSDEDGTLAGTDGVGVVHVCRDWEKVYEYVWANQMSDKWHKGKGNVTGMGMM